MPANPEKVAFDAYRLALGMLTYHNGLDSQNRLACAEWKAGADHPRVCTHPVILVQDLGSTFGKPGSFGGNSRGDFGDWQGQRVFANAYLEQGQTALARTANDRARRFYESLPATVWDDPDLPMTNAAWPLSAA